MTDITPLVAKGRYLIEAYGTQGIKTQGIYYQPPLLLYPDKLVVEGVAHGFEAFDNTSSVFTQLAAGTVLLIGTGKQQHFLPVAVEHFFIRQRVQAQPMDTGAACRTYNVLLSEERAVALWLVA
jgi:uncharacterized protein